MHHLLTPEVLAELPIALRHQSSLTVADGRVIILGRPLAGKAVCCMEVVDDNLWIIVDWEKPLAHRHLRAMLREEGIELMVGIPDPWVGTDQELILVPEPEPDEVTRWACQLVEVTPEG